MTDEPMQMLVSFPDQSESFTLGFEAGMIWQEIEGEGHPVIDRGFDEGFPIHAGNVEAVKRLAVARGYEIEVKDSGTEGWTAVRLTFFGTGATKPRLSVVS